MPPAVHIVIPCYNESRRLQVDALSSFFSSGTSVRLLFVDDGSTDNTAQVLDQICLTSNGHGSVLRCLRNGGKAEAVRLGLLEVMRRGEAEFAGYWDADLATPLEAIGRFVRVLDEQHEIDMVFGSRVKLLGRHVERNALRHYLGRIFATAASLVLDMPIYDTQCGAKLFRADSRLQAVVAQPFLSKWGFDVEVIARFHKLYLDSSKVLEHAIYEYPLESWHDIAGSKVRPIDFLHAFVDLLKIRFRYPHVRRK